MIYFRFTLWSWHKWSFHALKGRAFIYYFTLFEGLKEGYKQGLVFSLGIPVSIQMYKSDRARYWQISQFDLIPIHKLLNRSLFWFDLISIHLDIYIPGTVKQCLIGLCTSSLRTISTHHTWDSVSIGWNFKWWWKHCIMHYNTSCSAACHVTPWLHIVLCCVWACSIPPALNEDMRSTMVY